MGTIMKNHPLSAVADGSLSNEGNSLSIASANHLAPPDRSQITPGGIYIPAIQHELALGSALANTSETVSPLKDPVRTSTGSEDLSKHTLTDLVAQGRKDGGGSVPSYFERVISNARLIHEVGQTMAYLGLGTTAASVLAFTSKSLGMTIGIAGALVFAGGYALKEFSREYIKSRNIPKDRSGDIDRVFEKLEASREVAGGDLHFKRSADVFKSFLDGDAPRSSHSGTVAAHTMLSICSGISDPRIKANVLEVVIKGGGAVLQNGAVFKKLMNESVSAIEGLARQGEPCDELIQGLAKTSEGSGVSSLSHKEKDFYARKLFDARLSLIENLSHEAHLALVKIVMALSPKGSVERATLKEIKLGLKQQERL